MKTLTVLISAVIAVALAQPVAPSGQMKIDGKTIKFTNAYAYAAEGFFDRKKDDVVVLLSDRPLTDAQIRDDFAIRRLAGDGKLNCVRATVNMSGQMVNYMVGSQAFKAIPSGGSTEQLFEGTIDAHTISGKVHTKGEQEFFGTKYEYEATFHLAVQPRK